MSQAESLTGVLERILFHNEENHYCVGEFRPNRAKVPIVITGNLPGVQCGETLTVVGSWTQHKQFGPQLKVNEFESKLPSTVHGIRKYLGSGLVPGIGETYANKIVDHFKTDTLRIISEESARLQEVPGIGRNRAKAIKAAWESQHALREVFMFLKTYGVTNNQCLRLVKEYGSNAMEILKNTPYRMADEMKGIGFKTADKIALNLGLPSDGPDRIDACILYANSQLIGEGHTCATQEGLLEIAEPLLDIDLNIIQARIPALVEAKRLSQTLDYYQLPTIKLAEESIAHALDLIHQTPSKLPSIIIDKAVEWAQDKAGFNFAENQSEALVAALDSKISILTGGPGTGKTTILRALVDILRAKKVRITLAAPTGRAAQRLSQSTRHYAQTLHRLLKYDPAAGAFTHNNSNPINADFFIIDEASMLDTQLANAFFKAIPGNAHLLLVGDVHQLPSVGPGAILANIIDSKQFPTTHLNQVYRQKSHSSIISTAHSILNGFTGPSNIIDNLDSINNRSDFHFIKATEADEALDVIIQLAKSEIPKRTKLHSFKDIQVLAPMHKGPLGIANLNHQLQKALNPDASTAFSVGDKVIQQRNNYDKSIFNGDLGLITEINKEAQTIHVDFDGQQVELERSDLMDLSLAYAISIHKSQGSEFPAVIIPLMKSHFVMLKRNLIYTAITRGRKRVFVVGDPTAYAMAVNNQESTIRQTGLQRLLNK